MNLRLVICLGLALLAGCAHTANAGTCGFKSRDVIFPQDLFYFQEASPNNVAGGDDNVTVRIFFDQSKMSGFN